MVQQVKHTCYVYMGITLVAVFYPKLKTSCLIIGNICCLISNPMSASFSNWAPKKSIPNIEREYYNNLSLEI